MAVAENVVAAPISNDATWRAWLQSIHDALAGCGLVQTADTGQVAIATALLPTATPTATNGQYEIWRFNDTLQATAPIFLKIYYNVSAAAGVNPINYISVGKGTDGAGNLTNVILTPKYVARLQGLQAGSVTWACHTADGSFSFSYNNIAAVNTTAAHFSIDRFRNADGSPSVEGIFCHWRGNSSTASGGGHVFSTNGYTDTSLSDISLSTPPALLPNSGSAGASAFGTEVIAYPMYPFLGYGRNPSMASVAINNSDVGGNVSFQIPMYGANRTYRAVNDVSVGHRTQTSGLGFALRYE